MLVEPRYVDGENETVPMRCRKECVASKLRWENISKEMIRSTQQIVISEG